MVLLALLLLLTYVPCSEVEVVMENDSNVKAHDHRRKKPKVNETARKIMSDIKKLQDGKLEVINDKAISKEEKTLKPENRDVVIKVSDLRPHPKNKKVYGIEDIKRLEKQIILTGIIDNLIIDTENYIISGNRRWLAAQELNIETVRCDVYKFESLEEEEDALVRYNTIREKTNLQKAREGIEWEKIIKAQSNERKLAQLKQFRETDMGDSPTSGKPIKDNGNTNNYNNTGLTRDEVADIVGISSGTVYERMKKAVERIDKLIDENKTMESEILVVLLNQSPYSAYEFVNNVKFDSLSDDDKEKLLSGKLTPRKLMHREQSKENQVWDR